jgi:hypothetical protein
MSIQAYTAQARTYTRHGTHVQRHAGGARAAARSRSLLSKPLIHARHNAVNTLPLIPLQPRSECCTRSRGTALHCFRSQDIRTRAPLHFRLTNLHASSLYESVGAALSCCAHSFSCAHPCASPLYPSLSFLPGTHLWACSRSSTGCTLGSHKLADHTTTATVQRHHKHASMCALCCRSILLLSSPLLFFSLSLSLSFFFFFFFSFCLHSFAGFACCCCPCLCLPATSTHVAYPPSHSSFHLWHCHSSLAGSPSLLAELLLLLHSNMSHAAARKYQPKRISALQALPQDPEIASSQQREKQLMDQNRLSHSLPPFSDGQRRSSPAHPLTHPNAHSSYALRCAACAFLDSMSVVAWIRVCLCTCVRVLASSPASDSSSDAEEEKERLKLEKQKQGHTTRYIWLLAVYMSVLQGVWQSCIPSPYTSARKCMCVCACFVCSGAA